MSPSIFVCYSHEDAEWLVILKRYLGPIIENNGYGIWDDTLIEIGADWFQEINTTLETSAIGILLISHNFTTSKFIQERELPILLDRAERGDCTIFAIAIRPFFDEFIEALKAFQWVNSPTKTLQDFRDGPQSSFEKELIRIGEKLKELLRTFPPGDFDFDHSDLHILTGVKGGIGKTLLSLATLCTYMEESFNGKKLLCVDTNTTNNDLYRLIAGRSEGEMLPKSQWRYSAIAQTPHYVAKRRVQYSLHNGVIGFWDEVASIINHDKFHNFDVVIDTNLHIANLIEGPNHARNRIKEIFSEKKDRRIFLWVIWTFASLADDEYVQNGVVRFNQLFNSKDADKITIIHVLNPSALTAPHNNIQDEIKVLVRTQQKRDTYDKLIQDAEDEGRFEERDTLKRLRDQYLIDVWGRVRPEDLDLERARPFPGLVDLANHTHIDEDIKYDDFIMKIGRAIVGEPSEYLATVFESIYRNHFKMKGRPRNLLLISTYDPKLRGYTEYPSNGDSMAICKKISTVQRDVSKFLLALNMVPGK